MRPSSHSGVYYIFYSFQTCLEDELTTIGLTITHKRQSIQVSVTYANPLHDHESKCDYIYSLDIRCTLLLDNKSRVLINLEFFNMIVLLVVQSSFACSGDLVLQDLIARKVL